MIICINKDNTADVYSDDKLSLNEEVVLSEDISFFNTDIPIVYILENEYMVNEVLPLSKYKGNDELRETYFV